jgi:hypothetical protein
MLRKADELKKKIYSKTEIDTLIKDILYTIKVEIDNAVNLNSEYTVYKLPDQFAINANTDEIRTIVYYEVIKLLDENDYHVEFKITSKEDALKNNKIPGFYLKISWKNTYKNIELSQMKEFLNSKILDSRSLKM